MGIEHYTKPLPNGGVEIDLEAMMVDAVMVAKSTGLTLDNFLAFASEIWGNVKVEVKIPKEVQQ